MPADPLTDTVEALFREVLAGGKPGGFPPVSTLPTAAPALSVPGLQEVPALGAALAPETGLRALPHATQVALPNAPQAAPPALGHFAPLPAAIPPHAGGLDGAFYFLQSGPKAAQAAKPAPGNPSPYYFVSEPPAARPSTAAVPLPAFDIDAVRRDFPALATRMNGHPLVYLDNAATTQKPQVVIDATSRFYVHDNAPVHRAAYELAGRATEAFEGAREKVRRFLGAAGKSGIVFVRGTTEAVNLVANTFGTKFIGEGDEVIITTLEHHANIVPWQLLRERTGAIIRVVPVNDRGELLLDEFAKLLGPRTKLVSVSHVSNALGTINPIEQIIPLAHAAGARVLVDGAQSTPHLPVNVQALDADFFVFSGHKIFGPTGIGALYGKAELLESLPPWQGGGHMIEDVRFEKTTFRPPPERFEAGTPDIAGAVGLGAAIDYIHGLGLPALAAYEHALLEYATPRLLDIPGLRLIGTAAQKASVLSFTIEGIPNDRVAAHLDARGIAVRSGHHCALPAHRRFGLESSVRPSLAFYNNRDDVDALVQALKALVPRKP